LDQRHHKRPFRPLRKHGQHPSTVRPRPQGIRQIGNPRQLEANARNNYERYTSLAKDAARRGETIEAENLYQHAEHYFRVMREYGERR
jgi:hypothetical protein